MLGITKKKDASVRAGEGDAGSPPVLAPPVDVFENDAEFLVVAELPGVSLATAGITLEHDRLVLEAKGEKYQYRREMIVPPSVDGENVSAAMKDGVLSVHLPKRAPYRPRQIQVRAA